MTTTIDPTDDAIRACPETGLPITSRPEWTRRPFGKGYWFTTRAIGDRILFNQPCGHAQLEGLAESLKMTEAVIRSCIDLSAGYVLISDYSGMRGISREARTHYVRYMDQQDQMLGVVYFGVSPWFRIMINLARRLLLVKRKVYIEKDYRSAITAAMGLLGGETAVLEGDARTRRQWDADISEVFENGHHVLRCPRWRLALDDYTLTIEVIDRRIYHGISTGTMCGHHVAPVSQLRERVRRMLGLESGFPVIITTTADGQRTRRRVRHQFIDSLKQWHARYPLTAYIFYETNWFGRTAAMLASPLVPFRLRTVADFETALALADRFLGFAPLVEEPAVDVQPVPEVRQLLQFLGNIDWERQGMPIPAEIDAVHPFRPVFDAIAWIKGGLDAVFEARDQAEKALRESQQRFEEVLKHSRDILFKRDIQSGAYDYVSDAMMTFLGLTRQEIDALDFNRLQALVHPDDLPAFLDYNDRLTSRVDVPPDASACRYRLRDKQGNYLWFTDKRAIVRDAQGRALAVLGSLREITEQRLAEEERRSTYARFTTILDSIAAHILVADLRSFEILFMNRAMREEYGDCSSGLRCFEFFQHADHVCNNCVAAKLLDDQGQPTGVQTWEAWSPAKHRWYLNHDQAIRWVDGRMVRLQIAMDISRIKSLENERQEIAERLRRTRKLEAVSTLAGGVAHNFNNLLMVVLGNLELLRLAVEDNPDQLHRIDAAEKSATKAAELSALMLTYVGQSKISAEPLELNATLTKIVDVLTSTVADRASLTLVADSGPVWIHADSAKVYQVITNLVTNAVEASGDQPLEIQLSAGDQYCDAAQLERLAPGDQLPEGRYAWLRVSDNGRGMDQETLEKVFDPFFTTKFTGRGMGMAAVMGIMRAHRGGVRIDSRLDTGTAVTVYFPAHQPVQPAMPLPVVEPLAGRKSLGTALLVDDEPLVLELGSQMLALLGFEVITAIDGIEALKVFEAHGDRIVLGLLDINMPRMGGRETLERLRAMGAAFPVLVTSGFTELQGREKLGDVSVDGYINKPFRMDQLQEKIRALMSATRD